MAAALLVGRVGGLAVALGVGAAILNGTAIATADSSQDPSSAAANQSTSAPASTHRVGPGAATKPPRSALRAGSRAASARPSAAASADVTSPADDAIPASAGLSISGDGPSALAPALALADAPSGVRSPRPPRTGSPTPAIAPPPSAAVTPAATATAPVAPQNDSAPVQEPVAAPDPNATVETAYGDLGKWMINKDGEVADWVGIPYCVADTCKTLQEPINTIFSVQAKNKFMAEWQLNRALRKAGFPPSCCSSVGYKGILDDLTYAQMPRGGLLGLGSVGPGFIQSGLLGLLFGIGPAYRDASFLVANSHLRTFGGVSDGNGNYIFTASVSKEYLDTSTPKPTHGYESFDEARAKLLADMLATGATDLGLVEMHNEIPADDPLYSTGDHDGFAQVIAIGGMTGWAWRAPQRG